MENCTYFCVSVGYIRYTGCFFYRILEHDSIIECKTYTAGTSSDICRSQGTVKETLYIYRVIKTPLCA